MWEQLPPSIPASSSPNGHNTNEWQLVLSSRWSISYLTCKTADAQAHFHVAALLLKAEATVNGTVERNAALERYTNSEYTISLFYLQTGN